MINQFSFLTTEYCTQLSNARTGSVALSSTELVGVVMSIYLYDADLAVSVLSGSLTTGVPASAYDADQALSVLSGSLTTKVPASAYCSSSYEQLLFDLVVSCLYGPSGFDGEELVRPSPQ